MTLTDERIWSKIDASGDCWEWTGAKAGQGYGHMQVSPGRWAPAHRVVYEALVGPIPDGLQLDHLCRNRKCVNPDHLEPVTVRTNLLRSPIGAGGRARRTHCPFGHEYTPANTIRSKRNQRTCRECKRARDRAQHCFICHRSAPIANGTYVRVSFGDSVEAVCDDCMSKADEGEDLDETLDMTEGREGLPEFNGAFG